MNGDYETETVLLSYYPNPNLGYNEMVSVLSYQVSYLADPGSLSMYGR